MAPEMRLAIVLLAVEDLPRALRFYREAFGWPQTVDTPVYAELELPGGQRLGLYAHQGFARNLGEAPALAPPGRVTGTELYFHTDDVSAAIARIEAAGARTLSPLSPRPWGDEAAYFADPDGNVLVVARPLTAAAVASTRDELEEIERRELVQTKVKASIERVEREGTISSSEVRKRLKARIRAGQP